MKLYAYYKESKTLIEEVDAAGCNGDGIQLQDGFWFMDDSMEVSSTPDLSQRLREEWRRSNPSADQRIDILEELLAELIYGGEVR